MMIASASVALGVGLVGSLLAVLVARHVAERARLLDIPNERSSHKKAVPRVGGVGLLVGVAIALNVSPEVCGDSWPALAGTLVLAAVGLVDDVKGLHARVRFLLQFLVCVGFVCVQPLSHSVSIVNLDLDLAWISYPLHALVLMWMLNLFNFMDGIDGLAGSQLACAALFFWLTASGSLSLLGASLLGAAFGFLVWNWPQAKVFMGDVGSTSLGFLLGAMALQSSPEVPLVASMLVLLPFVFDATFTLLRRAAEKRRVWEAHRSHIYQLPQSWGVSNTFVLGMELIFLVFQLALGLLYWKIDSTAFRWSIVTISLSCASVIFLWVLRYARKNGQGVRW